MTLLEAVERQGSGTSLHVPRCVSTAPDAARPGAETFGSETSPHVSRSVSTLPDAARPGSVALGIHTRFASALCRSERRQRRYTLQKVAAGLLPAERVSSCGIRVKSSLQIWHSPPSQACEETGKAFFKGLLVCGSVWSCPVCAAKITERRRVELARGLASWGGSVFMVTYTFQHSLEDHLVDLVKDLNAALRVMTSGRQWQRFAAKYGLVGSVAGLESTISKAAGWHPHKHVLYFSRLPAGEVDAVAIESELRDRFTAIMAHRGRYASSIYGVRVENAVESRGSDQAALKQYITKWGLDSELAKSPVKAARAEHGVIHYSPFQLLDMVPGGDKWAAARFKEYAMTMKGHKQLVWSKGLRSLLGLEVDQKTDQQLVEEQVETGDSLLVTLTAVQWRLVVANDARAELLTVADSGDKSKVILFLNNLGVIIQEFNSS